MRGDSCSLSSQQLCIHGDSQQLCIHGDSQQLCIHGNGQRLACPLSIRSHQIDIREAAMAQVGDEVLVRLMRGRHTPIMVKPASIHTSIKDDRKPILIIMREITLVGLTTNCHREGGSTLSLWLLPILVDMLHPMD